MKLPAARPALPCLSAIAVTLALACGPTEPPKQAPAPTPAPAPIAAPQPEEPARPEAPPPPARPPRIVSVAAGGSHSCVALDDGKVRCWGANADGQLGAAGVPESKNLVEVAGLNDVAALALGDDFSCARLTGGGVQCWGSDAMGQLGTGTDAAASRPTPAPVVDLAGVTTLDAGDWTAAALLADGTLRFWGRNNVGQFGDGTEVDRTAPVATPPLTAVRQVALGGFFACALLSDASVRCWGWNEHGQLGDGKSGKAAVQRAPVAGPKLTGVEQLALGENHGCARLSSGAVSCWGSNEYGQLGDGTRRDRLAPVAVRGLTGAVELAVGGYHGCARLGDGAVHCWGANASGQLGDGTRTNASTALRAVFGLP